MKKILIIFGTRPEAIKMIPVYKEFLTSNIFKTKLCISSQQQSQLKHIMTSFNIKADYDLNVMKHNQDLNSLTTRLIDRISDILDIEMPYCVLVHGDTATAFAASIAAFHKQIKIAHIEAGLRTFNKFSPYPEEIYRQFIDLISDFDFTPTETTKNNLPYKDNVFVVGNSAVDALNLTKDYKSKTLQLPNKRIICLTSHRRENLEENLEAIYQNIKELLNNNELYRKMAAAANPYGDGTTSAKIVKILKEKLS